MASTTRAARVRSPPAAEAGAQASPPPKRRPKRRAAQGAASAEDAGDSAARSLGLSVWLSPAADDPLTARLQQLVSEAADANKQPSFEPHVTLFWAQGDPDEAKLAAACKALAAGRKQLELTLQALATSDTRFMCIYATVDKGNADLEALRKACEASLGGPAESWTPHLSLVYDLPLEERAAACAAHSLAKELPSKLRFSHLTLWEIYERVDLWRRLGSFALGGATARSGDGEED